MADWQPEQYLKFKNERTQPTIDLVSRISLAAPRRVIDIGCGPGNSTAVLRQRFPDAALFGLDSSENMIARAKAEQPDINWILAGAEGDLTALGTFDLVFSNAALQWMPAHERLIPALYERVRPGGILAVQVPYVREMPIYAAIQQLIGEPAWAAYFEVPPEFPKHYPPAHYYEILCGLAGELQLWQTDYIHIMAAHADIVEWYRGTGLRPFLDMLPDDAARAEFCAQYLARIRAAYPVEKDGRILLPFTRIFFTLAKGD